MPKKTTKKRNTPNLKDWAPSILVLVIFFGFVFVSNLDVDGANNLTIQGNTIISSSSVTSQLTPLELTFENPVKGAKANEMVEIDINIQNNLSRFVVRENISVFVIEEEVLSKDLGYFRPGDSTTIKVIVKMPETSLSEVVVNVVRERTIYNGDGEIIGTQTKEAYTNIENLGVCEDCTPTQNRIMGANGLSIVDFDGITAPLNQKIGPLPIWAIALLGIIGFVFLRPGKKQEQPDEIADNAVVQAVREKGIKDAQVQAGLLNALMRTDTALGRKIGQESAAKSQGDNPYNVFKWIIVFAIVIVFAIYIFPILVEMI